MMAGVAAFRSLSWRLVLLALIPAFLAAPRLAIGLE
jgi:hypothetical protein